MLQLTPHMRLVVCVEPIDFRNGIDGLVRICRGALDEDPFRGTLFVFRNRRATAVKVLAYDGQGFWLCQKRLSSGRFAWWPTGAPATTLATHELHALLAAGDPSGVKAAPDWRPIATAAAP
jgi:transposase